MFIYVLKHTQHEHFSYMETLGSIMDSAIWSYRDQGQGQQGQQSRCHLNSLTLKNLHYHIWKYSKCSISKNKCIVYGFRQTSPRQTNRQTGKQTDKHKTVYIYLKALQVGLCYTAFLSCHCQII